MECSAELSAATMYLYKLNSNIFSGLWLLIFLISILVVGVCMLAAINEKLRKYVDLKYQIEKDKFGSP